MLIDDCDLKQFSPKLFPIVQQDIANICTIATL